MRTPEQIQEAKAQLAAEEEITYSAQLVQEKRQQEALERAKTAALLADKARATALIQKLELDQREDAKLELKWYSERRAMCYIPAKGEPFAMWGLCQSFLNMTSNDELQWCDWCCQCQRGYQNPFYKQGYLECRVGR